MRIHYEAQYMQIKTKLNVETFEALRNLVHSWMSEPLYQEGRSTLPLSPQSATLLVTGLQPILAWVQCASVLSPCHVCRYVQHTRTQRVTVNPAPLRGSAHRGESRR